MGDVVLVQYSSKVSKADYRLARVSQVHPNPHGLVRTVTVAMRPRDSREQVSKDPPYLKNKPLTQLSLGVQRVVVVLPVEEQPSVPPESIVLSADRSAGSGDKEELSRAEMATENTNN